MAFSKVTLNGTVLMDITADTVATSNLLSSYTAHKADGTQITGQVGNAAGSNAISGGTVSCSKTSSSNVTMSTSDTYTNGVTMTFTGSRAAATATAAITTAGYAETNASFATDTLAADSATSTYYIQGVTLTTPSSGTRQFDITVPNGANNTTTFYFCVDSSGNTRISDIPSTYVSAFSLSAEDSNPYIDMNFYITDELATEIYYFNTKNEAFIFGARGGTSTAPFCNLNIEGSSTYTCFDYGATRTTEDSDKWSGYNSNKKCLFTFYNDTASLQNLTDGTSASDKDFSSRTFQANTTNPVYLFAANTNGTASYGSSTGTLRIYSAKFYVGGTMMRNLVPCVRVSDNVAGMYDKVSRSFFTSATSDAFVARDENDNVISTL